MTQVSMTKSTTHTVSIIAQGDYDTIRSVTAATADPKVLVTLADAPMLDGKEFQYAALITVYNNPLTPKNGPAIEYYAEEILIELLGTGKMTRALIVNKNETQLHSVAQPVEETEG